MCNEKVIQSSEDKNNRDVFTNSKNKVNFLTFRGSLVVDDGEVLCLIISCVKAAVERALTISCREAEGRHGPTCKINIKVGKVK